MIGRSLGIPAFLVVFALAASTQAQSVKQFKIGSGHIDGTYYPIGQIVARIITAPPGERRCGEKSPCGVPGLTASALTSLGSVENVEGVSAGWLDAGFVQSDVAYWAYTGGGFFKDRKPHPKIRAVASLCPESMHIIVGWASQIKTLAGLKKRVVALGDAESGTLIGARLLLAAAGLDERRDIKPRYLAPGEAAPKLILGEVDAFMTVSGYPEVNVSRVVESGDARLLPISSQVIGKLLTAHKFISQGAIPSKVYGTNKTTPTVNVNALMIVSSEADPELVYRLTKALWWKGARQLLATGHPKGKMITVDSVLDGIGIPMHQGAVRYYREFGRIK